MNGVLAILIILIFFISLINSLYNPIPTGTVVVATTHTISVVQPKEYGGTDKPMIIFTATRNMTIINTIFDPTLRDLYIIFSNTTTGILYISQLKSVERLHTVIYRLPVSFNASSLNRFTSFSSDIANKRAFLTDQTGTVTMFSMSGTMQSIISMPMTRQNPVRSVGHNEKLNRLFVITDSTVDSCTNLDQNNLQCCQALPKSDQLRSITFDPLTSDLFAYVIDERTGIYQVTLDSRGCPVALRPINTINNYLNSHLVIYQNLYFCSGSTDPFNENSVLIIGNNTQIPRTIPFDASIVALHISYPNIKSNIPRDETCFHGITYHDYRLAVMLAALFGTIMGIFMCFNALFCIDFFMTKQIIRDLKNQIPHNLLEDRWNKLVEEKYAKLALEIQRKKDDPQPKRKSSTAARKLPANESVQPSKNADDGLQVSNPIPKISAYLRRKSESYLSRRRSDEYCSPSKSTTTDAAPIRQEEIKEEEEQKAPQEDTSRQELVQPSGKLS